MTGLPAATQLSKSVICSEAGSLISGAVRATLFSTVLIYHKNPTSTKIAPVKITLTSLLTCFNNDWDSVRAVHGHYDEGYSESIDFEHENIRLYINFGIWGKGGYNCIDVDHDPATCYSESKVIETVETVDDTLNIVAHMHKEPDSPNSYSIYLTDKTDCSSGYSCPYPARSEFIGGGVFYAMSLNDEAFGSLDEFIASDEAMNVVNIMKSVSY